MSQLKNKSKRKKVVHCVGKATVGSRCAWSAGKAWLVKARKREVKSDQRTLKRVMFRR